MRARLLNTDSGIASNKPARIGDSHHGKAALVATMALIALMGPRTTGRNLEEINPI